MTHHFIDRAELVEAALAHARHAVLERALALPAGSTALDLLTATLPTDAHMVRNWRVWLSIRAAALHDTEMERFHREMYDEWRRAIELTARPDLGDATPIAVDHLMAVVDGIALRATLDPASWPPDRQAAHLAIAWAAVGSAPAPATPPTSTTRTTNGGGSSADLAPQGDTGP